jgi:hypothetical protein
MLGYKLMNGIAQIMKKTDNGEVMEKLDTIRKNNEVSMDMILDVPVEIDGMKNMLNEVSQEIYDNLSRNNIVITKEFDNLERKVDNNMDLSSERNNELIGTYHQLISKELCQQNKTTNDYYDKLKEGFEGQEKSIGQHNKCIKEEIEKLKNIQIEASERFEENLNKNFEEINNGQNILARESTVLETHKQELAIMNDIKEFNSKATKDNENKLLEIQEEIMGTYSNLCKQLEMGTKEIKEDVNVNFENSEENLTKKLEMLFDMIETMYGKNIKDQNELLISNVDSMLTKYQEMIMNMDRKIGLRENLMLGATDLLQKIQRRF